MRLTQAVHEAGRRLGNAAGVSLPEALREFLTLFVGRPYDVRPGLIEGPEGSLSGLFASVVFTTAEGTVPEDHAVPGARAAAVIDGCDELTLEGLGAAYARVAEAKRIRQEAKPTGNRGGRKDDLLGVVLALRSTLTLEALADEMRRLNGRTSPTQWPDAVAVANTGVVQYGAQFPGENITGDFFLPGETLPYAAPMYIVMLMKPTGEYTFNRMLALVVAHLALFAPGAEVPRFPDVVEGVPNTGLVLTGYQFNLAGALVPVARQFYNDRFLAPLPFIIEDGRGRVLATVQFLPWQDGGVILLRGAFPLEVLLTLLGPVAKNSGYVRRPGGQISYALPITEADFREMLRRFGRQSNMVVRADQTNWVLKKFADEGSASPFVARLLIGMLCLRDAAFPDHSRRDSFDRAYQSVTTPLLDARARMKKIADVWESHVRRVESGEIARLQGRAIHVDENVDNDLGRETDAFLSAGTRALKTGMQATVGELGVSIGFLFQKQAGFEVGLAALAASDPALADYLRQVRLEWSETLVGQRNAVEHEGWQLPDVVYARVGGRVGAREPLVNGLPVTVFAAAMFDRLSCFAEEVTAHLLQRRLMAGVTITEVPRAERPAKAPERFRLTLAVGGLPAWTITYHTTVFEET
jgi:hypothetical protein